MKTLVLASITVFAFAAVSQAQEKTLQLIAPEKLLEFPKLVPPGPGVRVQSLDLTARLPVKLNTSGVCSVPLLEMPVPDVDPGIARVPNDSAVPVPRAKVPAPACERK